MTRSQDPALVNQSQWSTASSVEGVDANNAPTAPPADTAWTLLLISSVMIAIPCILTFAEIRRSWQQWQLSRTANSSIPCKKCHFYSNNTQLKCAVHPSTALTDQAENCPDYRLKQTQWFLKKKSIEK